MARDSKPSTRNTRGRSKPVTIDIEATSSTAEPETPAGETAETAGMEPAVEIVEAGADPVDVPQEQASQEGGPVQDTLIDEKSVSEAEAEITEAALETASDSAPTDETMLEAAGGSPFDAPASETDAAPEMAEDSPATAEEDTPRQDASEQGAPQPAAPAPRRSGGGLVGGLVGGVAGAALAVGAGLFGLLPLGGGGDIQGELTSLRSEIAALQIPASDTPETSGGIDTETLTALEDEIAGLRAAIEELRAAPAPEAAPTVSSEDLAALDERLAALDARLGSTETTLAAIPDTQTLERVVADVATANAAVERVEAAVSAGGAGEAPALETLSERLAALEAAAQGAPDGAALAALAATVEELSARIDGTSQALAGLDRTTFTEEDRIAIDGLRGQIETMGERLEALSVTATDVVGTPPEPAAPDPDLVARIDALAAAIAGMQGGGSAIGDRVSAMSLSITQFSERLAALDAAVSALRTETTASAGVQETARAALAAEVAALTNLVNQREADPRAALAAGILGLQAASGTGAPFPGALAALAEAGTDPDLIASLEGFAADGAPTYAALRAMLGDITPVEEAAAPETAEEGGFLRQLEENARRLIRIEPSGGIAEAPPALAGLATALEAGDGAAAEAALQALSEEDRAGAAAVEAGLARRRALEQALAALTTRLTASE